MDSKKKTEALLHPDPGVVIDELEGFSRGNQPGPEVVTPAPNRNPEGKRVPPETSGVKHSMPRGELPKSGSGEDERGLKPARGGGKDAKGLRPPPSTPKLTCMGPNCQNTPARDSKTGVIEKFCGPKCEFLAKAARPTAAAEKSKFALTKSDRSQSIFQTERTDSVA